MSLSLRKFICHPHLIASSVRSAIASRLFSKNILFIAQYCCTFSLHSLLSSFVSYLLFLNLYCSSYTYLSLLRHHGRVVLGMSADKDLNKCLSPVLNMVHGQTDRIHCVAVRPYVDRSPVTYTYIRARARTHAHTHIYTHTRTHIHTHSHTHTHTCF